MSHDLKLARPILNVVPLGAREMLVRFLYSYDPTEQFPEDIREKMRDENDKYEMTAEQARICEDLLTNEVMIPTWNLFNDLPAPQMWNASTYFAGSVPFLRELQHDFGSSNFKKEISWLDELVDKSRSLMDTMTRGQLFGSGDDFLLDQIFKIFHMATLKRGSLKITELLPYLDKNNERHELLIDELKRIRSPDPNIFFDAQNFIPTGEKASLRRFAARFLRTLFMNWFGQPHLEQIGDVTAIVLNLESPISKGQISDLTNDMD